MLERLLLDGSDVVALRRWQRALVDGAGADVVIIVAAIVLVVAHLGRQRLHQIRQRLLVINSRYETRAHETTADAWYSADTRRTCKRSQYSTTVTLSASKK